MMQAELPAAVEETLIGIFQKCRQEKNLPYAKRLQAYLRDQHLELHPVLGNYLIPLLVECGSLPDAQQVFDRLPLCQRNAYSWTSLISGYIERGDPSHAFQLYYSMQQEPDCFQPTRCTFLALLNSCARLKDAERGKGLHADILKRGLERDILAGSAVVGNTLVDMYGKCGLIADAQHVFEGLPVKDVISWNALIAGYADQGLGDEAGYSFHQMQLEGVCPVPVTFVCSLKACGSISALGTGQVIHADATKRGIDIQLLVASSLVDMYIKCGSIGEAQEVFNRLPGRDTASWNALISGYAEQGLSDKVLGCFRKMQLDGVSPDSITLACSLKVCCTVRASGIGQLIHGEATKIGFEREVHVGSSLVGMYIKSGLIAEAQGVFEGLPVRNRVSWNAMIAGYAEHGLGEQAVVCFQKMQLEGIFPDYVTFVCSLKGCCTSVDIETGQEIHVEISKRGLEREPYVGNTLIDMYIKCGLLAEACGVFERLEVQDAVSWAALVAGYAEQGLDEEVLRCYNQMQSLSISVDPITLVFCLKSCSTIGLVETGKEFHTLLIKRGLEKELYVGSSLVDMYIKSGFLMEAQEVFLRLQVRDAVTWDALMAGYADHNLGDKVGDGLEQMRLDGVYGDSLTFVFSLKACSMLGAFETGRDLHLELTKRGLERELLVGSTLVDMYTKWGFMEEALRVLHKLALRTAVSWNTLIAGYAQHKLGEDAWSCLRQMQLEGICPDSVTFGHTLKACGSLAALETGREVHSEAVKMGMEKELHISTRLVDMYTKCGSLVDAREVFDRLPVRDEGLWNALISGYAERRLGAEARDCLKQMQSENTSPGPITFVCSLKACGTAEFVEMGQRMHAEVIRRGLEEDLYVGNTLVDMYCKCTALAEARGVFNKMPLHDAVSWSALIAGNAEQGLDEEVLNCFKRLLQEGISADAATFVLCLKACGAVGALDTGREVHSEIRKSGLEGDSSVGSMLIDMYGKCGSVAEGREVFDKLAFRDVISWTAMIKAYGENHEGNMAIACFEEMQQQGMKADSITFICLLAACSHASLIAEGQEYYTVMREGYGIKPTMDHFSCLVDLFARSGCISEAGRFAIATGCPSSIILTSLLSACKIYGTVELGQSCFQRLVEVDKELAAAHVLMADTCVSAGRLQDANALEEIRKYAGINKKPGRALIEVKKNVHEFIVGVNQKEDNPEMLEILSFRTRVEGYVPHLNLV